MLSTLRTIDQLNLNEETITQRLVDKLPMHCQWAVGTNVTTADEILERTADGIALRLRIYFPSDKYMQQINLVTTDKLSDQSKDPL